MHGSVGSFRSTTMLCLLGPDGVVDPAIQAHAIPILAWARLVWLQRMPASDIGQVLAWAINSHGDKEEPWRYVTGPGQAYVLTLGRLAWAPKSATEILMDDGRVFDMRAVPPVVLDMEVKAAVERWSWRAMARALRSPQLHTGASSAHASSSPESTNPA